LAECGLKTISPLVNRPRVTSQSVFSSFVIAATTSALDEKKLQRAGSMLESGADAKKDRHQVKIKN
jgi:hypothetical protein